MHANTTGCKSEGGETEGIDKEGGGGGAGQRLTLYNILIIKAPGEICLKFSVGGGLRAVGGGATKGI